MTDLQHTQRHPWLAKVFGYALLGFVRLLTGAQARWYGSPPKAEQRIYFANHQSHADLVMIWAALPEELRSITRPIAARDYWTKSDFKRWITTAVFNAVYVDRERQGDEDPLQPLIANVQRVMPKGEVVPVPVLCSVTFGAPIRLEPGEERRAFLDRARAAVIALRDV